MTRPETLFEAASYDLNQFRERRMADRRAVARNTPDRRKSNNTDQGQQQVAQPSADPAGKNGDAS